MTVYRPEPSSRHPIIVFFLAFTALYGVTILLGAQAPNSIQDQLAEFQVRIWGAALAVGGIAYILGVYLQGQTKVRPFTIGVAFEQVGAASLGVAAILYAVAVVATVGWAGAFPAGTTLAFGAACIYRWISILLGIRDFARAQHQA